MNNKTKKIVLNIIIFGLYVSFSYIVDFIFNIFNINIGDWKYIYKLIFIYSMELIPAVIMVLIYKKKLIEKWKDFIKNIEPYFDKYIRYWIFGITLMGITNILIGMITSNEIANNEEVLRQITNILPIYSIISSCLCAPIVEELIYRKTIKNIFNKKWFSIIIGGLLFGLAHVIGTYQNISDLLYIIPYGSLGAIFMYIYCDSDNIWTTISLHFIHNTLLTIAYFVRLII